MKNHPSGVCVVVAAKNAAETIGRAVRSALREAPVSEVVVVDDGSSDATAEASLAVDDGSGRLRILKLERNRGPAFARNHAIAQSGAPFIAILDADDFFLRGRFDGMLEGKDWDFVADNIVFIDERGTDGPEPAVPRFEAEPRFLGPADFIDGNISRRGASRGEIGFLKPVMRRAFLDAHGLRYDEKLRLGEDYDLYVRALLKGARYKIVHGCGYCGVVRPDSLSGRHRTEDLRQLYKADREILATQSMPGDVRARLERHERHIRARYELRNFLDIKAQRGLASAGMSALKRPAALPAIVGGIAADKVRALQTQVQKSDVPVPPRYLLPARPARK